MLVEQIIRNASRGPSARGMRVSLLTMDVAGRPLTQDSDPGHRDQLTLMLQPVTTSSLKAPASTILSSS